MIVSGALGQQIVPRIHALSQIHSIFVFCQNRTYHERWAKTWIKVRGIYTEFSPLSTALKQVILQCDQELLSFSIISSDAISDANNISDLESSFMYTQLIKEALLEIDFDAQALKHFVAYCREKYAYDLQELEMIKRFEKEYHQHTPIWWYTFECFLYPMLNRALRLLEIDTILEIGFFMKDLHQHITQLHREQFNTHPSAFMVYRGQGLSKVDFNKLKASKGGLISFNNFLSTSQKRQVSLGFARGALENPESVGIVFGMKIDLSISTAPFALLDKVSYYENSEKEILFSMHTVFRIDDIVLIDETEHRLYQVQLTLTSDNDTQLGILTKTMRKMDQGYTGWSLLGNILTKMSEYDKAEKLFCQLLEGTSRIVKEQLILISLEISSINKMSTSKH